MFAALQTGREKMLVPIDLFPSFHLFQGGMIWLPTAQKTGSITSSA